MRLKPLLVGVYATKSNSTESDLIEPFFSATVPGWSPSKVRKRIAISIGLGFVDVDKAGFGERLAHLVHVEPEHAGSQLLPLALLVRLTFLGLRQNLGGILSAHHHHAVVVGNDRVARMHVDAGTDHGDIDRP